MRARTQDSERRRRIDDERNLYRESLDINGRFVDSREVKVASKSMKLRTGREARGYEFLTLPVSRSDLRETINEGSGGHETYCTAF